MSSITEVEINYEIDVKMSFNSGTLEKKPELIEIIQLKLI